MSKMTDDVFWSLVDKSGECWLWTGALSSKTGYGKAGRRGSAHEVAWLLTRGERPAGTHLDHLCRVRLCCNPDHLEPVTPRENLMRGKTLAAANAAKTHCPKGHEYAGSNLRMKGTRRLCRTCSNEQARAYQARRRLAGE